MRDQHWCSFWFFPINNIISLSCILLLNTQSQRVWGRPVDINNHRDSTLTDCRNNATITVVRISHSNSEITMTRWVSESKASESATIKTAPGAKGEAWHTTATSSPRRPSAVASLSAPGVQGKATRTAAMQAPGRTSALTTPLAPETTYVASTTVVTSSPEFAFNSLYDIRGSCDGRGPSPVRAARVAAMLSSTITAPALTSPVKATLLTTPTHFPPPSALEDPTAARFNFNRNPSQWAARRAAASNTEYKCTLGYSSSLTASTATGAMFDAAIAASNPWQDPLCWVTPWEAEEGRPPSREVPLCPAVLARRLQGASSLDAHGPRPRDPRPASACGWVRLCTDKWQGVAHANATARPTEVLTKLKA